MNPSEFDKERSIQDALFGEAASTNVERDSAIASEVDAFRLVEARLKESAALERDRLLREPASELESRLEDIDSKGRSGQDTKWMLLGAAAAALLVMLFGWWSEGGANQAPEELPLGTGQLQVVHPRGVVDSFSSFEWVGELPPGGSFEVRVWALEDGLMDPPRIEEEVEVSTWQPDSFASLPSRIRWEVRAWGPNGEALGSDTAQAECSQ